MAFGNEILFGRIAVYNGLVTTEQLDECLAIQRWRAGSKHVGQIMIERGLIDEVQARAVLSVQRRRLHRGGRGASAATDKRLCEMLVRDGTIDQSTITRARRAKEEMEDRGLFPSLGDILVQQGGLGLSTLSHVQARLDRRELWCVSCGQKYNAHGYRRGIDARCPRCGGRLLPSDAPAPPPPEKAEGQAPLKVRPALTGVEDSVELGTDTQEASSDQQVIPGGKLGTDTPDADGKSEERRLKDEEDNGRRPRSPRSSVFAPLSCRSPPSEPVESFVDQLPSDVRARRPASEAFEPKVGDVIGGRCRLEEMIGEGGWGHVYRARDLVLDREVAVKVLAPHRAGAPHLIQRFLSEARAAARLVHPNIVVVHDIGEDRGVYYMNMHFVHGKSVQQLLNERGRFDPAEALRIISQTAEGLDYAHRKRMVHRDVKPGNIMIGDSGQVTIVDFGLTKHMGAEAHITTAGMVVGTVQYMSPEQADGRPVDGRSDLYSLGVTLFEMLTGCVPFDGDSPWKVLLRHQKEPAPHPTTLCPELPEKVAKLVMKLMAKDPGERPASGADLVTEIDALL